MKAIFTILFSFILFQAFSQNVFSSNGELIAQYDKKSNKIVNTSNQQMLTINDDGNITNNNGEEIGRFVNNSFYNTNNVLLGKIHAETVFIIDGKTEVIGEIKGNGNIVDTHGELLGFVDQNIKIELVASFFFFFKKSLNNANHSIPAIN